MTTTPTSAERAKFDAWLIRRAGPTGDEPGYPGPSAMFHDQEMCAWEAWQARAALAAPEVPAPVGEPVARMYVMCGECSECGHIGINDQHETDAACGYPCGWSGPSPKDDKCPGCGRDGVMNSACPKCSSLYHALAETTLATPAVSPPPAAQEVPQEVVDYPRDLFDALIAGNSPYAFYLFQWVPYQTDAKRWRLKMKHDVRTFDGREAFGIWPNGSHCGPFKDEEVEFIRISRKQWGDEWKDPRALASPAAPEE